MLIGHNHTPMNYFFEILGYLGTAFLLLSFLMSSVVRLRVLNTIGSLISFFYLMQKGAYPTAFMNAALVVINLIHLFRMYNQKASFTLVASSVKDACTAFFLEKNKDDIALFFPDFAKNAQNADYAKTVWCKNEIAGVFAAKKEGDDALDILIDYTSKGYRDCSAGEMLFASLKDEGIKRLTFKNPAPSHKKYLLKMGFVEKDGVFTKEN